MPLKIDLDPGDILVVPPESGAKIKVQEKSGRRTSLLIESKEKVTVLRAKDQEQPNSGIQKPVPRPVDAKWRPNT